MKDILRIELFLCSLLFSFSALSIDKVIYGGDDRYNMFEYPAPRFIEMAHATAVMIPNSKLEYVKDSESYKLDYWPMKNLRGYCSETPFLEQNTIGDCSGFLISPTVLVTAGHCIKNKNSCKKNRWVFGYNQQDLKANNFTIPKSQVYECKIIDSIVSRKSGLDYAVVSLDRAVIDRPHLKVRTEGEIEMGQNLVVIGHPTGLPTKIADNAYVRSNSNSVYFITNLDTFGGNSGSAVINEETGLVEGILARGEDDYIYDRQRGCYVNNQCDYNGCRGEDVTRITSIKNLKRYIQE